VGAKSPPQTVVVTNTGNLTLNIAGISLTGADRADFIETTTCGSSLAPGDNCSVTVTFAPPNRGEPDGLGVDCG
jgi:trimeric autotransporter adhesin